MSKCVQCGKGRVCVRVDFLNNGWTAAELCEDCMYKSTKLNHPEEKIVIRSLRVSNEEILDHINNLRDDIANLTGSIQKSEEMLDSIRKLTDQVVELRYDFNENEERMGYKLREMSTTLSSIGTEAFAIAEQRVNSFIEKLDRRMEIIESNATKLNHMMLELKGAVSMSRAALPKRGQAWSFTCTATPEKES